MNGLYVSLTAEEYFKSHEPLIMELFLDREKALEEETEAARRHAERLKVAPTIREDGSIAFPLLVWLSIP